MTGSKSQHRVVPVITVLSLLTGLLASACLWGVVRDTTNGAPIAGAAVTYVDSQGHSGTAITGPNGLYSFDPSVGPVSGPVTVNVSAPGYHPLSAPVLVQYNDNPHASLVNLASFWEVQHFGLIAVAGGPTFDPAAGFCINTPPPAIDRIWQVSAPRGVPSPVHPNEIVQIGLRNKLGVQNEAYSVLARVTGPGGASATAPAFVSASDWAYLQYPTDFAGAGPLSVGVYTIIWESGGGFLACDGFIVEPF